MKQCLLNPSKMFYLFLCLLMLLSFLGGGICFAADEVEPAVAGGGSHSVLLQRDGTVWCWGANTYGQLGNGTTDASHTPLRVEGLTGIIGVTAGLNHTVALKDDGTVWTWGRNNRGQLGNDSTDDSAVPVQVGAAGDFLMGVTAVAAGVEHTVALLADGSVWAWGYNLRGQLGDGTQTRRLIPVPVQTGVAENYLTGVELIAAGGEHTVVLKSDGTVWAWGLNSHGQLGDGSQINQELPVQVITCADFAEPLQGVVALAAGRLHSLALGTNGKVWAWGANDNQQLGNTESGLHEVLPVEVSDLDNIVFAEAGWNHSLALKQDGTAWTWGHNDHGQLGDGTFGDDGDVNLRQVVAPSGEGTLEEISSITGGSLHTLALQDDDTVWAWGYNHSGRLGDGTENSTNRPLQVLVPAPPQLVGKTPGADEIDVSTGAAVELIFNENIREGITYDAITVGDGLGNPVAFSIAITGEELRLEPVAALDYSTVYTVTIPRWAVQGMPGNLLGADVSYSFTTEAGPDTTPPAINLFTINEGAALTNNRNVLLQIGATDDITAQADLQLRFSNDNVSWSDWEAYASEKAWVLDGGDGAKLVYIGVKDEAGNVAVRDAAISLDTAPPFVTNTDPANGAADIPVNQPLEISIIFNEAIYQGHQFNSITMRDDEGISVELEKSKSGALLRLQTIDALLNNKTYTVYLPAESLQDAAGNELPEMYIFSFQTSIVTPEPEPDPWPQPDPHWDYHFDARAKDEIADADDFIPAYDSILNAAGVYSLFLEGTVTPLNGNAGACSLKVETEVAALQEGLARALLLPGYHSLALMVNGTGDETIDLLDLDIIDFNVPFEFLQDLTAAGLNLILITPMAELEIPLESMAAFVLNYKSDLNLIFERIKDPVEQFRLVEQGRELLFECNMAGEPVRVATSFSGPTRVVFPLPGAPVSKQDCAKQLYIQVEHSDGEMELLDGEFYHDDAGAVVGLGTWVDRFSTFTLLEPRYKKVLCMQPDSPEVTVFGGEGELLDVPPFIHGEAARLMVPVRFLGEVLGGQVMFLPLEKKITIDKQHRNITLYFDSDRILVNGEAMTLPCPVAIVKGRTFAPARFISDALGANVHWDSIERKVIVTVEW